MYDAIHQRKQVLYTRSHTTGFTIVELLIVIVIIAILAAITIVAYSGIQQRVDALIKVVILLLHLRFLPPLLIRSVTLQPLFHRQGLTEMVSDIIT